MIFLKNIDIYIQLLYLLYLGLPAPKKYQAFCTIRRFIKFMVVSSVPAFPKKLGVVCHGCVSHQHGPVFSPVFCSQFTRFLDLRAFAGFAGVLRTFAGVLRVILGAVCAFICVGARDMRMAWYVFGTQPGCKPCSVIIIQNVNCGDSVATRKQNQAN